MRAKYRVTWQNNGRTIERIVTKSKLADLIDELTFWGKILTIERIE